MYMRVTLKKFGHDIIATVGHEDLPCQVYNLENQLGVRRPKQCSNMSRVYIYHPARQAAVPTFDCAICAECMQEHFSENIIAWVAAAKLCYPILDYAPWNGEASVKHLERNKHYCEHDGCCQPYSYQSPYHGRSTGLYNLCARHAVKYAMLPEMEDTIRRYYHEELCERYMLEVRTAWPALTSVDVVRKKDFPHTHYMGRYLEDGTEVDAIQEIGREVLASPELLRGLVPAYAELSMLGRRAACGLPVNMQRVDELKEVCRNMGLIS